MPIADITPASDEGSPVAVCPECNMPFYDREVLHCPRDGTAVVEAPLDSPVTRVDRVVGGRYRILTKIGEGGMGTVYIGEHALSLKRVALKIIRPELESSPLARRRFLRECETLNRINSPNVVKVLESGESKAGEIYLVMELLEGETLGERIDRAGALPMTQACQVAAAIGEALVAAHSIGVVHRDLKPDNVFLCNDGTVRVLDFGIARLMDGGGIPGGGRRLTATGAIVGTPAYISPEAVTGDAVGPAADLYSLGVMLFEMLAGELPFFDEQAVLMMGMHLSEPAPDLRDRVGVPSELAELVNDLLAKSPDQRPRGADVVGAMLGDLASGVHSAPWVAPERDRTDTNPDESNLNAATIRQARETPRVVSNGRGPLFTGAMVGLAVAGALVLGLAVYLATHGPAQDSILAPEPSATAPSPEATTAAATEPEATGPETTAPATTAPATTAAEPNPAVEEAVDPPDGVGAEAVDPAPTVPASGGSDLPGATNPPSSAEQEVRPGRSQTRRVAPTRRLPATTRGTTTQGAGTRGTSGGRGMIRDYY